MKILTGPPSAYSTKKPTLPSGRPSRGADAGGHAAYQDAASRRMAGLVPAIQGAWMPGTSPGMTVVVVVVALALAEMTATLAIIFQNRRPNRLPMSLKLFELVGTDASRPFSPFCWRTRMALAHKGLSAETIPWCFTDKPAIAPHRFGEGAGAARRRHGQSSTPGRSPTISRIATRTGHRCSAARAAAPWGGC